MLERAEAIVLTPGETHLFFSWERDPNDTFRWVRLPSQDGRLVKGLASYKTLRRVAQFGARIGETLPNEANLRASAEMLDSGLASKSAVRVRALAAIAGDSRLCHIRDAGSVLLGDSGNAPGSQHVRQRVRTLCEELRQSSEDPLGVALRAFRNHPDAWHVVEKAAGRCGYTDHLPRILLRRRSRSRRWRGNAVLRRLRPATAHNVDEAFVAIDSARPIHSLANAMAALEPLEHDHSRQSAWDRSLVESAAESWANTFLGSHFPAQRALEWATSYSLYLDELRCSDLEEQGGAELAAAILEELRLMRAP